MRIVSTALVSILALAVAACGGDSSGPAALSPESLDGVYNGESTVVETTLEGSSKGTRERKFALKCSDDACTQVYVRTEADVNSLDGKTYAFDVEGDRWTSVAERTGDCTPPATGTYVERVEWRWTRGENGSITGEGDHTFTGCKLDGTSRLTASADAERTSALQYMEGETANELKQALTDYDRALAGVYRQHSTCSKEFYGSDARKGGRCFERLLATWQPAVEALNESLSKEKIDATEGTCNQALAKAASGGDKMIASMRATGAALAAARTDYNPAARKLEALLTINNEPFQPDVVAIATQCIAPDDLEGLGENGKLTMDVYGAVKGS